MNISDFYVAKGNKFKEIVATGHLPKLSSSVLYTMRDACNWVMWRREERDGRITKVPYNSNGFRASATNPSTWTGLSIAVETLAGGEFDGIGFVINQCKYKDSVLFIDLDHCIDDYGELSETAAEFVEALGNGPEVYCELSQSGRGIHFLIENVDLPKIEGRPNGSYHNSVADVEFYDDARYVALTGRQIAPCFNILSDLANWDNPTGFASENYAASVLELWEKYRPRKDKPRTGLIDLSIDLSTNIDSAYVLRKCMEGKHGDTFRQLYYGGYEGLFGSHSEADLFLCGQLAFWTDCNAAQIDSIFRSSALMRSKWDRTDYRERTIGEAIAGCRETISEYRARRTQERRNELAADFFNKQ